MEQGKPLGKRYRLVRPLGRGGMASVWEAEDAKLKRRVAVKVLAGRHAGRADALARFERECMAVARLRSPHIVQVYDYGVDADRPFMVMELLTGETLSERLHQVGRLPWPRAVTLARHLGKALATAHEAGIVHRDLKPGNVFLVRDHQDEIAKVFDFGISKALDLHASLTHDAVVGTPSFMSPEQMRESSEVDARSDLWSFGVILYRACTGRLPFTGSDLRRVIAAVTRAPVPPVHDASLPSGLDAFFYRALAKEPAERFANALEMVESFATLGVRPPLRMLPPPPPRRRKLVPPPLPVAEAVDRRTVDEITMALPERAVSETRWTLVATAALLFVSGVAATVLQTESATREPLRAQAGFPEVPLEVQPVRIPPVKVPEVRVPPVQVPPVKPQPASAANASPTKPRDLFEEPW